MKNPTFSPASLIEPLEARIAPAAVLPGGKDVTWTDIDGDAVTLHASKAIFTSTNVNDLLIFTNSGSGKDLVQQLQVIDFTAFTNIAIADGLNISVTATQAGAGDGKVNVGFIKAAVPDAEVLSVQRGVDLGNINIQGDLGGIYAGDRYADAAVQSITVDSWGKLNASEQAAKLAGTIPTDLRSILLAGAKKITINGDFDGTLGARLQALGDEFGKIGSLKVAGSIIGGAAAKSGQILVTGSIGNVDVDGSLIGGAGESSGTLQGYGGRATSFGTITIGTEANKGGLTGGTGTASGSIIASKLGAVSIAGNITGNGAKSGVLQGALDSLKVGGSVVGGSGAQSGAVFLKDPNSQATVSGSIRFIQIDGNITGGSGQGSGQLSLGDSSDNVTVKKLTLGKQGVTNTGSITGGSGYHSGAFSTNKLLDGTVFGSITGGSNSLTGLFDLTTVKKLHLFGSILGGSGTESGFLNAVNISDLAIDGSIVGGASSNTGVLSASGTLGKATITGNLTGGTMSNGDGFANGIITAGTINSLQIGNITAGTAAAEHTLSASGAITANSQILKLKITGDISGTSSVPVLISAVGLTTGKSGMAIKSIEVGGSVDHADIAAGYNVSTTTLGAPANADAQIGVITIGKNLSATNIVAGATAGTNGTFGNTDDAHITKLDRAGVLSSIASIIVEGQATTGSGTGSYGIVADQLGSIKIGTSSVALASGAYNDRVPVAIPGTTDFHAIELAKPAASSASSHP